MKESKFQLEQKVRCVNEKQYRTICSIIFDGAEYFYNLIDKHGCVINRSPEVDLREAND